MTNSDLPLALCFSSLPTVWARGGTSPGEVHRHQCRPVHTTGSLRWSAHLVQEPSEMDSALSTP